MYEDDDCIKLQFNSDEILYIIKMAGIQVCVYVYDTKFQGGLKRTYQMKWSASQGVYTATESRVSDQSE